MSDLVARSVAVLVLGVVAWVAVATAVTSRPPAAEGLDAAPDRFSAARAVAHVEVIASRPRPTGSAAHEQVRKYLVDSLTGLGIDTEVRGGTSVNLMGKGDLGGDARYAAARIRNVVGHVPGTASTRPIALVTHYDSTAPSPGANDAGVPVSVLLEAARALKAGPPPRNDVHFVFTDGEEIGLLGAKAVAESPSGLPDDAIVLNFEARGSAGPTLMFETGADAAWLIDLLGEHVTRPLTSSLFGEAYRHLPNLTDFTVFKAAGHTGLNFAYLEGYTRYHGPDDVPSTVDSSTVQHQGEHALGLARALAVADLAVVPSGDAVFFTAAGLIVSYPDGAAPPLALAVLAFAVVLLVIGRRRVSLAKTGAGLLIALAHPVIAGAVALLVVPLVGSGHPEFEHYGDIPDNHWALVAFALLAVASSASLALAARRWIDAEHQMLGAVGLWLLLACATAVWVPGASYVFLWPGLGAVGAAALLVGRRSAVRSAVAVALLVVPAVVIVLPLVGLLSTALGLGLVAVAVGLLALGFGLLPVVGGFTAARLRWPGVAATAVTALVLGVVVAVPGGAAQRRAGLGYFLDADTGSAQWLAAAAEPLPDDEPTSVTDLWPAWRDPVRRASASPVALTAPTATVDVQAAGKARVTATSPRGATELAFVVTGARVLRYTLDGVEAGPLSLVPDEARDGPWELWVRAVPPEGVELVLDLEPGPVVLRVADRTAGLPIARPGPEGDAQPALGETLLDDATFVATTRSWN